MKNLKVIFSLYNIGEKMGDGNYENLSITILKDQKNWLREMDDKGIIKNWSAFIRQLIWRYRNVKPSNHDGKEEKDPWKKKREKMKNKHSHHKGKDNIKIEKQLQENELFITRKKKRMG